MMQRPNNPGVGRRERKHAAEEKASQQTAGAGNPWEHDIDIVNLMGESDASTDEKVKLAKKIGAKKLLDALEGKVGFEKVGIKLPVIAKDPAMEAVKRHPLAIDQHNYLNTNLRRFNKKDREKRKKGITIDENNPVFARAVSDLSADKQRTLLQTLSKISKSLEFGGLNTTESKEGVVSHKFSTRGMEAINGASSAGVGVAGKGSASDDYSISDSSFGRSMSSGLYSSGLSSNYSTSRGYGRPSIDYPEETLATEAMKKIGEGMSLHNEATLKYSITTGRSKGATPATDLVAPTQLMTILRNEFETNISTAEVSALYRRFDTDDVGNLSLGALLGGSKLAYDKLLYIRQVEEVTVFAEQQKKELAAKRAEYKELIGGLDESGNKLEGSLRKQTMKTIIDKLANAAYIGIRSRQLKPLNAARARLSSKEFRQLLLDLRCDTLLPREISLLERRYYIGTTGSIDLHAFKAEYIQLGKDVMQEKMRAEALAAFMKTLQGANQLPPQPQPDEQEQTEHVEEGVEGTADTAVGDNSKPMKDLKSTEGVGAKLDINDPLSPNRPLVGLAERFRLENNGVDSVGAQDMTIEMAEEWIADPLGGKGAVGHVTNAKNNIARSHDSNAETLRSPVSMLEQYGPGVDTTGLMLAKHEYGHNQVEGKSHHDDDVDDKDDALSAVTFDASSVAASNSYADYIASSGAKSSGMGIGSKGGGSSVITGGASITTHGTNKTGASERSKARERFYKELDTAKAAIGDHVSFEDALTVATVSASGDEETAQAAILAAKSGANVAKAVQKATVEKNLPGVGRAKKALSSGYIHKKALKPSTPEHAMELPEQVDMAPNNGPAQGGGGVFEDSAGSLQIPVDVPLSEHSLSRHNQDMEMMIASTTNISPPKALAGEFMDPSPALAENQFKTHSDQSSSPPQKVSVNEIASDFKPNDNDLQKLLPSHTSNSSEDCEGNGSFERTNAVAGDIKNTQHYDFKKSINRKLMNEGAVPSIAEMQALVLSMEDPGSGASWKDLSDAYYVMGEMLEGNSMKLDALAAYESSLKAKSDIVSTIEKEQRLAEMIRLGRETEYMKDKTAKFCAEYVDICKKLYQGDDLTSRLAFASAESEENSSDVAYCDYQDHSKQTNEAASAPETEFQLGDGSLWQVCTTDREEDGDGGYAYYYEIETGHTQWEDPREHGRIQAVVINAETTDNVLNVSVSEEPYEINV